MYCTQVSINLVLLLRSLRRSFGGWLGPLTARGAIKARVEERENAAVLYEGRERCIVEPPPRS